jgi:hypothetical protein
MLERNEKGRMNRRTIRLLDVLLGAWRKVPTGMRSPNHDDRTSNRRSASHRGRRPLNPLWQSNGLPLSSTWMLEFIKLLKDECDEVGQQLDLAEADVARLRSGEATPDMIAAGIHVLNASGAIEHPLDANEVLVADIYRAMVRARSRDAAVQVQRRPECSNPAPSLSSRTRAIIPYAYWPIRTKR